MTARIIDGKKIAAEIELELKGEVDDLIYQGIIPSLTVIQVGNDPRSEVYIRKKREACDRIGIKSKLINLSPESNLIEAIKNDKSYGILVQLPLPKLVNLAKVFDAIPPEKDVDVFNPYNLGLLVQGNPRFKPCTPHAVQQILNRSGINVAGKKVVVINRSNIIGKPLSVMLIQDDDEYANATVTVCHDKTPERLLKQITRQADIVIVAVGIPGFLTGDHISEGVTVIDVGISRVEDKIVGDVDFESVFKKAGAITPVPGGVGPVTICMLLMNTIIATKRIYL